MTQTINLAANVRPYHGRWKRSRKTDGSNLKSPFLLFFTPEERAMLESLAVARDLSLGGVLREALYKEYERAAESQMSEGVERENRNEVWRRSAQSNETRFSQDLSQYQITRRWIWSRLCGFPNLCFPGDARINDARYLYKRGQYYYGLKPYSIRRAAESLGLYPRKEVPYIRELAYTRPYLKGWRPNERSWASVRNPLWRDNRDNIGKGYCDWIQSAPICYSHEERVEIAEITKANIRRQLETNPTINEFHYERPELFQRGFTKESVEYVIRSAFIEDLIPQMKIDDEDPEGEELFELYDLEQIYGKVRDMCKYDHKEPCSRKKFQTACYSYRITADKTNRGYRRTHGMAPFLDVVDRIKLSILRRLRAKTLRRPFDMKALWDDYGIDDVKERMLYDAAVAELVYEGFLRVTSCIVVEGERGIEIDVFDEEPTGREIDLRLLYLHTLSSPQRSFPQQRPLYYGKYIGYRIWDV